MMLVVGFILAVAIGTIMSIGGNEEIKSLF